jgi:hypothetical protein
MIGVGIWLWLKRPEQRAQFDRWLLRLPWAGRVDRAEVLDVAGGTNARDTAGRGHPARQRD